MKGAEQISTAFSVDPVNLSTGNFIYDRTDLHINGSRLFVFRRFYNAINHRSGSLGDDWNHNYEVKLEIADKERILVLEEGKEERFLKTSTGVYTSLYHSNGSLEETEDGYLYKNKEQTGYYFDNTGRCFRQDTMDGSITNLYYETIEKEKRLVKVERKTGEAFLLTYSEDGYLQRVLDHTGRSVAYQMQGAKLIGVCTLEGIGIAMVTAVTASWKVYRTPEKSLQLRILMMSSEERYIRSFRMAEGCLMNTRMRIGR